jgi:hypothetical protein
MLKDYFEFAKQIKDSEQEQRYVVGNERCVSTIYITDKEIKLMLIMSCEKGGATETLNILEKYSKEVSKEFKIINIVNPKFEKMILKRGYTKTEVPLFEDEGETIYESVYKYEG